jgi:hypothetical protein
MSKQTRQRLLELMVARIGAPKLAFRLQVPPGILRDWIDGKSAVPDAKVIALIDLIDETAD